MCAEMIKGALQHKGFAYVNIFSQCPTFNKIDTAKFFREIVQEVPEDHDTSDVEAAMRLARRPDGKAPVGLLYKEERETLDEAMAGLVKLVGGSKDYDLNKIVDANRP
jgi:2-oxoglutarate ferredoxin oxidoreductase subunit beta